MSSMTFRSVATAVFCCLALLTGHPRSAIAQDPPPDLINRQIEIAYVRPTNPEFEPIYERLQNRKVLETLQQFLAPLKLKDSQKILVKFEQCGTPYARFKREAPAATVCYELVEQIGRLAPTAPVTLIQTGGRPVKPDAAVVGPVVQALIHEVAIAAFELLEIPVWGRADDAADRMSALVMLQFSKFDLAWNTIVGTAWFLAGSALAPPDMADVRGTMAQRYYSTLCIAYGGDRTAFGGFVAGRRRQAAAGDLPDARAAGCPEEYRLVRDGYNTAIKQYVDAALLERVRSIKWITFND